MIFYNQDLSRIPGVPWSTADGELNPNAAGVQQQALTGPLIATAIPFEQPDSYATRNLRQFAMYLSGIREVGIHSPRGQ